MILWQPPKQNEYRWKAGANTWCALDSISLSFTYYSAKWMNEWMTLICNLPPCLVHYTWIEFDGRVGPGPFSNATDTLSALQLRHRFPAYEDNPEHFPPQRSVKDEEDPTHAVEEQSQRTCFYIYIYILTVIPAEVTSQGAMQRRLAYPPPHTYGSDTDAKPCKSAMWASCYVCYMIQWCPLLTSVLLLVSSSLVMDDGETNSCFTSLIWQVSFDKAVQLLGWWLLITPPPPYGCSYALRNWDQWWGGRPHSGDGQGKAMQFTFLSSWKSALVFHTCPCLSHSQAKDVL